MSKHELTRAGLTTLLSTDPERVRVVGVGMDGHRDGRDVTVYDLADLHGISEDDLADLVASTTPIVGLAPPACLGLAPDALAIEVAATVPLAVTARGLLETVEMVAASWCTERATHHSARRAALRTAARLTDRELTVLELIAAGLSNREIAEDLWVSINSVKTYIRNAYRKVGVTRRAEAVLWAYHHGLAASPDDDAAAVVAGPPGGERGEDRALALA